MQANTSFNLRSALWRVSLIYQKNFLKTIGLLLACISMKYVNRDANLLVDNAKAWYVFLVAILVALMASEKIKLASRNTSDLPITSNETTLTRPISDIITCCIFLISGSLAQFCLLYILQPLLAWLSLCSPLFLFDEILSHSSYSYHKAVEWLVGISSRAFNILHSSNSYYYQKAVEWLVGISSRVFNIFEQIFRPPEQGRSNPQASNDAPATAV